MRKVLFLTGILVFAIVTAQAFSAEHNTLSSLEAFRSPIDLPQKTFSIDMFFRESGHFPLNIKSPVTTLSVSGFGTLQNARGYARIILQDSHGSEYLIFEVAYPFYQQGFILDISCEETCDLNNVVPSSVSVEVHDADIYIDDISFSHEQAGADRQSAVSAVTQRKEKVRFLNRVNREYNLLWVAGVTPISQLRYEEKKSFFGGRLPNLMGFEYYRGGIFNLPSEDTSDQYSKNILSVSGSPTLPFSFDWRNRHGENWVTPVTSQVGATCWAFSALAATEGAINLYYNQHIDVNLSEQDSICRHSGSCGSGGASAWTFTELRDSGLVDEECLPVLNQCTDSCDALDYCQDWSERLWFIDGFGWVEKDDESIKSALIEKGTINFGIVPWWHAMTLVGYETADEGEPVWILKNSWGTEWGEGGYGRVVVPENDRYMTYFVQRPYFGNNPGYQVQCVDNDSDGYCSWGISGDMPDTCPDSCDPEPDCNDADASSSHFGAPEVCDGLDNNCDGRVDEGFGTAFNDVSPSHWAQPYVSALTCAGITYGCTEGEYCPTAGVSRAQMAAFIVRAKYGEDFTYSDTPSFSDVPDAHWAFKYIQKVFEEGISTGCGENTFCPDMKVTRAQMVAFIIRALYGEDFSFSEIPYFTDLTSSHWSFPYIQKVYEDGISTGYDNGTFRPQVKVNKAQVAVFIARAFLGM
jgi:hypothetical protein